MKIDQLESATDVLKRSDKHYYFGHIYSVIRRIPFYLRPCKKQIVLKRNYTKITELLIEIIALTGRARETLNFGRRECR